MPTASSTSARAGTSGRRSHKVEWSLLMPRVGRGGTLPAIEAGNLVQPPGRLITMRKRLALLAVGAVSLLGLFAAPGALAAGQFCYDLHVNAGGTDVVNQTGCQDLP